MIRILLCDDEPAVMGAMEEVLREVCAGGCIVRLAQSGEAALAEVRKRFVPDIAFLDILMPDMDGVELARAMRDSGYCGEIVFLSSSNEFGHQSYRVQAMDYLLKPIDREQVRELIARFMMKHQRMGSVLAVGRRNRVRQIPLNDVAYVEVIDHDLYFHMTDLSVIKIERERLSDYLDALLKDGRMAQCHRSYVVNLQYVRDYAPPGIQMLDGTWINITRKYADFHDRCLEAMFGRED